MRCRVRLRPSLTRLRMVLLGLIRDRIAYTLDGALAADINTLLEELHTAASQEDLQASADAAGKLLDLLSGLGLVR